MASSSSTTDPLTPHYNTKTIYGIIFGIIGSLFAAWLIIAMLTAHRARRVRRQLRNYNIQIPAAANIDNAPAAPAPARTPAPKGLKKKDIAMLPQHTFSGTCDLEKQYETDQTCMICFLDYKRGDSLIDLSCNHSFHSKCVSRWLRSKASCPLCSHSITEPAVPPQAHTADTDN
ncbi:hypothetical protein H4S02_003975 [Coemansia sp. RSA 2611]|nr:hypothetical protein IWW54_004988 [Coemansia sp. RSA 2705]KAJ2386185.1 hypothetical protein H4S02_003975 [Coemansia sp. RSA 2611]